MSLEVKYNLYHVPTIREFQSCNSFIKALMGPLGSGKSSGCVLELIRRGLAQVPGPDGIRKTKWAVIRNTYGQLRDTSIQTFHQWFPPNVWGEYRAMDHRYLITAFEGAQIEVLFRALDRPDQVANLLSLELTGAWVNEAREVPWAVIEALQGRVGRFPAQRDGGPSWHGIIMDTNPPDVDSRWYKFFEEAHPETGERITEDHARLFKQPSGLSPEAENLANLPGGRKYYDTIARGKDPEWVKVYVHGRYGFVIDGKPVYPEYIDQVHCRPVEYNPYATLYRGWDFGLTPACVFLQVLPTGQVIVIDELVSTSMSVDQFSDEVLMHTSLKYDQGDEVLDIGDPSGEHRQPTDTKTCFQILHSKGINIEGGSQTLAIRLESVRKPLKQLAGRGEPQFMMDPRCRMLRKGFQGGYQYRRLQTSAERFTMAPDKNQYSHPHDALQYPMTRIFGGGLTRQRVAESQGGSDDFSRYDRSPTTGY